MGDPQESVYLEFLNYDWSSFSDFQEGLSQILEGHLAQLKEQDPSVVKIPPAENQQLIDQAKSFFYCSHTGNILNLDDFYVWKRNNGGKITLLEEVKAEAQAEEQPAAKTTESEDVPYSSNYQNLVELIVSGKPVPGIKQIPDTVLSEQVSKLLALTRRKPWEAASSDAAVDIQEMTT